MHELSVMREIIERVADEAKRREGSRVRSVTLEIGELTFLGIEQMRFAFKALTENTSVGGAELKISEERGEIECECGYRGPVKFSETPSYHRMFPLIACPECGERPEIVSGKECVVRNITLEVPDVQV